VVRRVLRGVSSESANDIVPSADPVHVDPVSIQGCSHRARRERLTLRWFLAGCFGGRRLRGRATALLGSATRKAGDGGESQ